MPHFRPASRRRAARRRNDLPAAAEVLEPRALLSATGGDDRGDHDHGGHCHCGHCGGGGDRDAVLHALPLPDRTLGPSGGTGHYRGTGDLRPLDDTFELQSNPGADHTIFLDFDGHVTRATYWRHHETGSDRVVTAAFNATGGSAFADSELETIQGVWQRVAEDFLPFDVNVTTRDPGEPRPCDTQRRRRRRNGACGWRSAGRGATGSATPPAASLIWTALTGTAGTGRTPPRSSSARTWATTRSSSPRPSPTRPVTPSA